MPQEKRTIEAAYNVVCEEKGNNLVITIDKNAIAKLSSTGKSHLLASTSGNVEVAQTKDGKRIMLGLNAYIPRTKGYVD